MNKFIRLSLSLLLLAGGLLLSPKAHADHAAGGEIFYTWVSDSTYTVYLKFYRDCSGILEPSTVQLCYRNTCNTQGGTVNLSKVVNLPAFANTTTNGNPVVTPCPGTNTACNGGSYPGYKEWWYSANVTLNSQCNHWIFSVSISARSLNLNNLSGPGSLYIESTFDNLAAQGNSSPYFTVPPVPYVCINQPYTYNNGAVDPNNDSVSFEIVSPRNGACASTSQTNLLSGTYNLTNNPFPTGNTFSINAATGQISFTPTTLGKFVITVKVHEWRNGIEIGTILRDIQVVVIQCNNVQPQVSPPIASTITGANYVNGRIEACATQPFGFCLDIKSADTAAVLVVVDNHTIACPGSSITYTGQLTDSVRGCFSWTASGLDTGIHILTFTVKDSNCAGGGIILPQTFSVPVYIYPITEILKDTTICLNDSVRLLAVGGSQFTWTVLPGGSPLSTLSCTTCKNPYAKPTVTTRYVVNSNLNSLCNKSKDTVTITVAQLPVFSLGNDTTTCINNSMQLHTNIQPLTGITYTVNWSPTTYLNNGTSPNPITTPKNDIRYIVTVTPSGQSRCAAKDTLNITVLQGYKLWNVDTAICKGQNINVHATGDTRYNFSWTPAIGVSNPAIMNPVITPDTTRRYLVKASFPGCTDSVSSFGIDVQPVPVVYAGADQNICYGDTVHLHGIVYSPYAPNYPNYSYLWTPGGALNSNTILDPIFSGFSSATLTLTVKTPAGCTSSDNVSFLVVPKRFLELSNDTSICPGDTVNLQAISSSVQISWKPDLWISSDTARIIKSYPITTTAYTATAMDSNHCIDTQRVVVTVYPGPLLSLPDSIRLYPGDSYMMDPGGNCLYFTWFPQLGLSNPNIANPLAMPAVNTRYFVNATTEAGCKTRDSVDVMVSLDSYLDVPNAFTPGSNPNAVLYIVHSGTATLNAFNIYNRWGTKVFSTTDLNKGWDGTFNGVPQPLGVYIYMVDAITPTGRHFYKQGNVTLLR